MSVPDESTLAPCSGFKFSLHPDHTGPYGMLMSVESKMMTDLLKRIILRIRQIRLRLAFFPDPVQQQLHELFDASVEHYSKLPVLPRGRTWGWDAWLLLQFMEEQLTTVVCKACPNDPGVGILHHIYHPENEEPPGTIFLSVKSFDEHISFIATIKIWMGRSGVFLRPACHDSSPATKYRYGFEGIRGGPFRHTSGDAVMRIAKWEYSLLSYESESFFNTLPTVTRYTTELNSYETADDAWDQEALSALMNRHLEALSDTLARHRKANGVSKAHMRSYYVPQFERWSGRGSLLSGSRVIEEQPSFDSRPGSGSQTPFESDSENDCV